MNSQCQNVCNQSQRLRLDGYHLSVLTLGNRIHSMCRAEALLSDTLQFGDALPFIRATTLHGACLGLCRCFSSLALRPIVGSSCIGGLVAQDTCHELFGAAFV